MFGHIQTPDRNDLQGCGAFPAGESGYADADYLYPGLELVAAVAVNGLVAERKG